MKELGKVLDKALVEAVDSSMHGKPSLRDVAISVGKDVCTWPAAFLHLTSSLNLRDGPQLAKLPSRELTYSTNGKGNSLSQLPLDGIC